jgi:hypothetical protein
MTLECASYLSQVVLTGITAVAAYVAYHQVQTFKKFELLKILEDPRVRKARRLLYQKLRASAKHRKNWWQHDDKLEEAASTVCASFDIVGLMAKGCNRHFFRNEWAYNICWTYEVLGEYIKDRNPGGYRGYHQLYKEARPYRRLS